jgi:hypothetical protein
MNLKKVFLTVSAVVATALTPCTVNSKDNTLNRPGEKPLADEYSEKVTTSLAALLSNDSLRATFMKQSNDLVTSFKGGALQHEELQFREYSKSVREDTIKNHIQDIITSESDRAFNIAVGSESGRKHFAGSGKPTTSPKGAIGIAQVMPKTGPEAAKLAGLIWDKKRYRNDPAYNLAIGKAYFEKQLKNNNGSLAKAYAAYNAGPAALAKAIKKADKEANTPLKKGKRHKTWIDFLPTETQLYIAKNMKAFSAGGGTNEMPTLLDVQQQVGPRSAAITQNISIAPEARNPLK